MNHCCGGDGGGESGGGSNGGGGSGHSFDSSSIMDNGAGVGVGVGAGAGAGAELTRATAYADMTSEGIARMHRPVRHIALHRPRGVI